MFVLDEFVVISRIFKGRDYQGKLKALGCYPKKTESNND